MSGPWEQYQDAPTAESAIESGPWAKYSGQSAPPQTAPAPAPAALMPTPEGGASPNEPPAPPSALSPAVDNSSAPPIHTATHVDQAAPDPSPAAQPDQVGTVRGFAMGLARGAKDVVDTGAQLLASGFDKLAGTHEGDRVAKMNEQGKDQFANKYGDSTAASVGRVGGQIAATLPVGGALGGVVKGLGAAGIAPKVLAPVGEAIATGGLRAGAVDGPLASAARFVGGAINGGASAGLVEPSEAGTGAAIGAALPGVTKAFGAAGQAVGKAITGGPLSAEVTALAQRARELGIDIPVDRIVNSKPLNALAAGLNYVPFSGRTATEDAMQSQLNQALSRTFGQDSPNVTLALRRASIALGGEFDRVLKANTVKVDMPFITDLADVSNKAIAELDRNGSGIIAKQVSDIVTKAATGEIDGQAAYNIKKTLDRIGNRNSPEAFYARELKKSLMGALDRSLGPDQATAFAQTRKQYGNMLSLQGIAQNGAEGNVSIARIANMKDIGNPELQELADISAQFLKPREGNHGAAQRAFAGLGVGSVVGVPALAGTVAMGRAANAAMQSPALKRAVLGEPVLDAQGQMAQLLSQREVPELAYRAAPVVGAQ